jgi:hypothetical protein
MLEIQKRPIEEVRAAFSGVLPAWYDLWTIMDVDRGQLLSAGGRSPRPVTEAPAEFDGLFRDDLRELHPLDAELAVEFETRLPSWILLINDRASMANGVEARVPLLDHEIVELVASLHPSLKMRGFTEKAVFRGAVRGLVPECIRKRQKRPFYTPLKSWFFSANAPEYVGELMSERALRDTNIFAPEVVKKLRQDLDRAQEGYLIHDQLEWILVQVLGVQLLHHLFVSDFDPRRKGAISNLSPGLGHM